jgi:hypothetical protein
VKGSIISSSHATEDTTPAAGQVTMTTSRTQRPALVLGLLAGAVVAQRPSLHLEMIPEGRYRHEQTAQPQQGLG